MVDEEWREMSLLCSFLNIVSLSLSLVRACVRACVCVCVCMKSNIRLTLLSLHHTGKSNSTGGGCNAPESAF